MPTSSFAQLRMAIVLGLLFIVMPTSSLGGWGRGGFSNIVDDLRADVNNRIRGLKGKNPKPNPNLKYQLPVSFLHVPEDKRDGEPKSGDDIEVWVMPKDKAKLAHYYGLDGIEESLPWRLYCLICESKTVRQLNRLLDTRKEPINVYVMVQEHVYGRDLGILGYFQSRDAIIFPWKLPASKEFYADPANPERLRGLLLHEVAHSQDKTRYIKGGYGPDGAHSFNEITHKQMAYLEGWAYFNEALVSSESHKLISGTVDSGCERGRKKGYLKKEVAKGNYRYINRRQLSFDDFLACESYPAAIFLALQASEPLFPQKEMDRIMAAWNETNEPVRDVVTVLREYVRIYPQRAFSAATILDVITDFSASKETFAGFSLDGRDYVETRRAKIKRLWHALAKKHNRISFAALAAGDIDGLIDIHLPDPDEKRHNHYIVKIKSAHIAQTKDSGDKWDIALPQAMEKSLCDPYVVAYVNGYQSPRPFLQTNVKTDEQQPQWSATAALRLQPTDKVVFYLFDKDKYNDDLIGECTSLTAKELGKGGDYNFHECGQVKELIVTIRAVNPDEKEYMELLGQETVR